MRLTIRDEGLAGRRQPLLRRIGSRLACATLLLAPTYAGELPREFAELVPEDTSTLVVARSADELARELHELLASVAPASSRFTGPDLLGELLGELLGTIVATTDVAAFDTSRPFAVALPLDASGMEMTVLVPLLDAAEWSREAPKFEGHEVRVVGRYAALSSRPGRGAPTSPWPLLAAWPDGLLTICSDAAGHFARNKLAIDALLGQLEQMLESGAIDSDVVAFEMIEPIEALLRSVRAWIASARRLDVVFDVRGGEYSLEAVLGVAETSPFGKQYSPQRIDYAALAAHLDPDASVHWLSSCDVAKWSETGALLLRALEESIHAENPKWPELAQWWLACLDRWGALRSAYGPVFAQSVSFDSSGLRSTGWSPRAELSRVANAWSAFCTDPRLTASGFEGAGPRTERVGEHEATTFRFEPNLPRFGSFVGGTPNDDDTDFLEQLFARVVGAESYCVACLPRGGGLAVLQGGNDAWRPGAARRILDGVEPSAALAAFAAELDGANPAQALQVDVARVLAGFESFLASIEWLEAPPWELPYFLRRFSAQPSRVHASWAVRPDRWTIRFDVTKSLVLGLLDHPARTDAVESRREVVARDFERLDGVLDGWSIVRGGLPETLDELLGSDADGIPCLETLPLDPWGRPYRYRRAVDGESYVLTTFGADGERGGLGEDEDLEFTDSFGVDEGENEGEDEGENEGEDE